ncbi:MAG: FecR domain-containing protein [Opitutae bacterium]|nr:FecR domain-containing protein [Opitutae bacterium]
MLHLLLMATVLRTPVIEPTNPDPYTLSVRTVVGTATVSALDGTKGRHKIEGALIGGSSIATNGFVATGDKSSLILDLPDGCSVWVGPNTQIQFVPYAANGHDWRLNRGVIVAKVSNEDTKHSFKVRPLLGQVMIKNGAVRVAQYLVKIPVPSVNVDVGAIEGTCEYTAWARPKKDGGGLIKAGDEVQASITPLQQPNSVSGPNLFIHPLSPSSEAEVKILGASPEAFVQDSAKSNCALCSRR